MNYKITKVIIDIIKQIYHFNIEIEEREMIFVEIKAGKTVDMLNDVNLEYMIMRLIEMINSNRRTSAIDIDGIINILKNIRLISIDEVEGQLLITLITKPCGDMEPIRMIDTYYISERSSNYSNTDMDDIRSNRWGIFI